MEQHDVIATPHGVGSSLSANIPDTSLVPRRRGRPMIIKRYNTNILFLYVVSGHCSASFSSDSSLENTHSSMITSNQTQVNTNAPFYDTDLLPRRRGIPPLTDISNDLLPRCRGKPPLTDIPNDLLPRHRGRPPLSVASIGKQLNL
nr:hypothetical protein [Tanacetum cinerariifolium]